MIDGESVAGADAAVDDVAIAAIAIVAVALLAAARACECDRQREDQRGFHVLTVADTVVGGAPRTGNER